MSKELKDLTFDELVKWGVENELDNIVQGLSLKSRVYSVMMLATQWAHQRSEAKKKS